MAAASPWKCYLKGCITKEKSYKTFEMTVPVTAQPIEQQKLYRNLSLGTYLHKVLLELYILPVLLLLIDNIDWYWPR